MPNSIKEILIIVWKYLSKSFSVLVLFLLVYVFTWQAIGVLGAFHWTAKIEGTQIRAEKDKDDEPSAGGDGVNSLNVYVVRAKAFEWELLDHELRVEKGKLINDEINEPARQAINEKIAGLKDRLKLIEEKYGSYISGYKSLDSVQLVPGRDLLTWADFVSLSSHYLTLILTVIMGGLGSLISITVGYLFGGGEERRRILFSWYLFRPILGMVTAMSVFVLTKAGQVLSFSGGAGVTDVSSWDQPLSPYFVGFLGIIAGLISRQAIEKIEEVGANVFKLKGKHADKDRWFHADIKLSDEEVQSLAELCASDDKTIERWVSKKEAVPASAQRLFAAWLRTGRPELFTDLRPQ